MSHTARRTTPPATEEPEFAHKPEALKTPLDEERARDSLRFVISLVRSSIYTIAYARDLFPEEQFKDSQSGIGLRTRASASGSDLGEDDLARARTLRSWINDGVRECVAKRYCRTCALIILDDGGDALEQWSFHFSYPSSSTIALDSRELSVGALKTQFTIIRNELLYASSTLEDLPPSASALTIRLEYTSSAPPDFVPTGFVPCSRRDHAFRHDAVQSTITLSVAKTRGSPACEIRYQGRPPSLAETNNEDETPPEGVYSVVDTQNSHARSLKDDDGSQTQLDSALVSPPKKRSRAARSASGPPPKRPHGGDVPICSQDSAISCKSYDDEW